MSILTTPVDNNKASWKNGSEKFENYKKLRDANVPKESAVKLAGYSVSYMYFAELKYRNYAIKSDPKLRQTAHSSIKSLAKGKKVGDMEEITGSHVLGASQVILDRTEPKINYQVNANFNFSPVDLSEYKRNGGRKGAESDTKQAIIDNINTPDLRGPFCPLPITLFVVCLSLLMGCYVR